MVLRQAVKVTMGVTESREGHDTGEPEVQRKEDAGETTRTERGVSVERPNEMVLTSLENGLKKEEWGAGSEMRRFEASRQELRGDLHAPAWSQ